MAAPALGPVLVTGCSSGIGRATARHLAERGHTVYATARQPDALADLVAAGCRTLALDVTDEGSMRPRSRRSRPTTAPVGALVNNAGYGQSGAGRGGADRTTLRRQFETNVFGLRAADPAGAAGHARGRPRAGSSTCRRWAGASRSRAAAPTTPPSTRSRPSRTRCAARWPASACRSSSSSPGPVQHRVRLHGRRRDGPGRRPTGPYGDFKDGVDALMARVYSSEPKGSAPARGGGTGDRRRAHRPPAPRQVPARGDRTIPRRRARGPARPGLGPVPRDAVPPPADRLIRPGHARPAPHDAAPPAQR